MEQVNTDVLSGQVAALSPEKRALFEQMLAQQLQGTGNGSTGAAQAAPVPEITLPQLVPAPGARNAPFPLTEIQQAQWIGGRSGMFELGKVAAHLYVEFDCVAIDLPRLNRAWQRLVAHHEQLRMVIRPNDLQQEVLAEVPPYEFEVLDLDGVDKARADAELMAIRERMSHQVFPGDRWPLFEIRASQLGEGRTRLHVGFDLLVADAWSFRVLMDRWMRAYLEPDVPLPALDISFRDYVLAVEAVKTTELHQQSLAYWRERLPNLPPPPELPLAKHPSALSAQRSVHFETRLEPETWDRLRVRLQRAGLTPSALFLAAFAEAIGLWSKNPRFTMNVTVFNRLPVHPQVNDILVGEFNSFVLLSLDHSQVEAFAARARRLQDQLWESLENRFVSGVQLMRELAQVTGRTSGALMPVVFTSTLAHYDEGQAPTLLPGELVYEISQTPQIWMEHHIWLEEGAILLRSDVVNELFPDGFYAEMWSAYGRLLHRLAEDDRAWDTPDTRSWLLPPQQLAEREAVNATAAELPIARLDALVAQAAAQRPTAPAVISGRGTLSYAAVEAQATDVGMWLHERGVSPNRLVAVVMEPGWEQVVAALGVLKAGAAYLPIEPTQPTERLHYLLAHGEVRQVLTQAEWDAKIEWPDGIARLVIEEVPGGGRLQAPPAAQVDDLAYVIYTSGSTGQPKGVMIDHRGAANTILDLNDRFGVGAGDALMSVSSLGFDLSVYDIFGMLSAGGRIVLPEASQWRDASHWFALMHQHNISVWNSVPALMEMLVEYVASRGEQWPASLRLVLLSGDWIPVGLPDRIRALGKDVEVVSLGGATEASIWSIAYPIGTVDPAWESIPYGRPLRNQRFAVLNEQLEPSPMWVPGHLYIGGVGLARGYWRDEENTRASFITHPRTGERLYRTGDLGRYMPGGDIQFLGREDLQVKVRGYRIELGEIETALQQHENVQTAVVVAVGSSNESRRLVAYVVGRGTEAPEPDALASFLRSKVPDYMVPGVIEVVDALPLNRSGKVDRKALSTGKAAEPQRQPYVAPRNELEEQLAEIWTKVLSAERVGVHDNFFELGGNSLLATQLVFRVRDAFQVELPLFRLFEAATVAKLAVIIEELLIQELESMDEGAAEKLLGEAPEA
ncbi:MAG TPA: amino acid adenylation domain-containing protein [Vicinamibacterales bacterium]